MQIKQQDFFKLLLVLFPIFIMLIFRPAAFAGIPTDVDISQKASKTVTPEMFGAIGDGEANDTHSFKLMTDYMTAHHATAVLTGDYLVESVELSDNGHIIGKGGVLRKIPNNEIKYAILTLNNNCTIEGLTLIGDRDYNDTDGQWGHCIYIEGDNCEVKNCTAINPHGDGIYIHGNDAHIDGCMIERAFRNGISVTDSMNFLIENTKISNVYGHSPEFGIDIEPNNAQDFAVGRINNIDITNCCGGILIYTNAKQSNPFNITCGNARIVGTNGRNAVRFRGHTYNGDCYDFSNIWIINPAAEASDLIYFEFLGENNPTINLSAKIVGETSQRVASIYTEKYICDKPINLSVLSDNPYGVGNTESSIVVDSLNPNIKIDTNYFVEDLWDQVDIKYR